MWATALLVAASGATRESSSLRILATGIFRRATSSASVRPLTKSISAISSGEILGFLGLATLAAGFGLPLLAAAPPLPPPAVAEASAAHAEIAARTTPGMSGTTPASFVQSGTKRCRSEGARAIGGSISVAILTFSPSTPRERCTSFDAGGVPRRAPPAGEGGPVRRAQAHAAPRHAAHPDGEEGADTRGLGSRHDACLYSRFDDARHGGGDVRSRPLKREHPTARGRVPVVISTEAR